MAKSSGKRVRFRSGDVFQIALPGGKFAYGRLLLDLRSLARAGLFSRFAPQLGLDTATNVTAMLPVQVDLAVLGGGSFAGEYRDEVTAIRAALQALETGEAATELKGLDGISRSSPVADWKLFVRGLAAYYRVDEATMKANWSIWSRNAKRRCWRRSCRRCLTWQAATRCRRMPRVVCRRSNKWHWGMACCRIWTISSNFSWEVIGGGWSIQCAQRWRYWEAARYACGIG